MAAVKSVPSTAPASEVRAWAREQGTEVGSRGRFAPSLVEAYNAAHPERPYVEAAPATKPVTFKGKNHRTVTRTVVLAEARAALIAAGQAGTRGPLSQEALVAFASGEVKAPAEA